MSVYYVTVLSGTLDSKEKSSEESRDVGLKVRSSQSPKDAEADDTVCTSQLLELTGTGEYAIVSMCGNKGCRSNEHPVPMLACRICQ